MQAAGTKATNKRGSTRTRMLLSAAEVLRERGAAGVTIDEVLARSGAPRGSVYHHFPEGRTQILTEALRFAGDSITAIIDEAGDQGGIPLVRKFVEFWERTLAGGDFNAGCPVVAARSAVPTRTRPCASSQPRSSPAGEAHSPVRSLPTASRTPTPGRLR
jgi:AcrR family transcriptional regulator